MVDLRPFRGWRYDAEVAGDPASVLSPPYDLITPENKTKIIAESEKKVIKVNKLYQRGIITEDEFEAKKKQLLGL